MLVRGRLVASTGNWSAGTRLSYQWFLGTRAIAGASGTTLVLSPPWVGQHVQLVVTGRFSDGGVASARWTSPRVVSAPGSVGFSGSSTAGKALVAAPSGWMPGSQFTYQWLVDGRPVAGATGVRLVLSDARIGHAVQVRVTGTRRDAESVTATSAAVRVAARPMASSVPTVRGELAVGSRLTANTGRWTTGARLAYLWRSGARVVSRRATLVLPVALRDRQVTLTVTGSRPGYVTTSRTSSVTSRIAQAARPSIVGTPRVGQTLRVRPGAWTPGARLRVDWLANGRLLSHANSLKLPSATRGQRIVVRVTGTKQGYPTLGRSSAATKAVAAAPAPKPRRATPPKPRPVIPAPARVFANCDALHEVYPHGVAASADAQDAVRGSTEPVTNFAVVPAVYNANSSRLDRDGDGIACEKH